MLTPGEKIGIYEIVSSLGAGGMGEVYRARDTKLQRDVALASLNHLNTAVIYSFEESTITGPPGLHFQARPSWVTR